MGPLLILSFLSGWWYFSPARRVDPDHWYHKAISREMLREGWILRQVPQVEDLGWGFYFPDKEFLFHVYTAVIMKIAGEKQFEISLFFLSLIAIFLLYLVLLKISNPFTALAILCISIFLNPSFMYRLTMLRPHVLAILLFIGIIYGIVSRKEKVFFVFGILFSLSYHAFYIPLVPIIFLFILSYFHKKEEAKNYQKLAIFGFMGIGLGIIVNPYFPSNIVMSYSIAEIAIYSGITNLSLGRELIPDPVPVFFRKYLFYFLLLTITGIVFLKTKTSREEKINFFYWLSICILFWCLTKVNPRAIEYSAIVTAVVLTMIAHKISLQKIGWIIVFIAFIHIQNLYASYYKIVHQEERDVKFHSVQTALSFINEPGSKVYNCNWDDGPYIFYHRPDLRFVDILDPTLLFHFSKEKAQLREMINRGMRKESFTELRKYFSADYVLCRFTSFHETVKNDTRFELIYMEKDLYLWKLIEGKK